MSSEEAKLIQRAKEGDPDAFSEIYDCHQPAIYRYILYRVKDVEIAEDLTSEVFVRLVERIDTFTYRGRPLLAWLYTIARNLITDYHRTAGRTIPLTYVSPLVDSGTDPEKAAGLALTHQKLAAALDRLTQAQREVVLLKFIEGFDNATVARILNKSVGAVKALQHRGIAALRRILKKRPE